MFAVNPYDICITNSTINREKWTIACSVEGNKVSQIDEEVNTKLAYTIAETNLNSQYQEERSTSSWEWK